MPVRLESVESFNLIDGKTVMPTLARPARAARTATLVCLLLLSAPFVVETSAKETWTRVRSKNFTLVGNAGEKDVRQVATRLEQFRDVFSRLFSRARLNTHVPSTVVVFKSHGAYKPFAPPGSAGYFQAGEDVNYIALSTEQRVGDEDDPFHVIFHEYTHLLVNNNVRSGEVPAWFGEGLAEFYSTFRIEENRKVTLGIPISNHVHFLRQEKMIPLRTLFAVDHSSPFYNERDKRGVFYAQSWALMHYFLLGRNERRQQQFAEYMKKVDGVLSPEEAFQQVFGTETEAIEKELRNYVKQSSYQIRTFEFEKPLEFDSEMTSAPISEAEAQAYLGDLLLHSHQLDRAETYLQKAAQLDPKLTMAHTSLGLLRVRQDRFADARQFLERAVGSNTQNYLAHYYYSYALIDELRDQSGRIQSVPATTAEKLRLHLKKAIELAPEFPEPYDMLAFVNLMTEQELDESVKLVRRAMALAPSRHHFGLTLGQVHLRRKDFKAARQQFEALASNSSAEEDLRTSARSFLGVLDSMERYEREMKEYQARTKESQQPGAETAESADNASAPPRMRHRSQTGQSTTEVEATPEEPSASTLRPRREGEEQARGLLLKIDCSARGVTFQIKVGERLLHLFAPNFERIDFVTYTTDVKGELSCGARNPPNHVLVTYRPAPDARNKSDGQLVAVDFIPKEMK